MLFTTLEDYGVPVWGPTRETKNLLATGTWSGSNVEQSFLRISQINNSSAQGLTTLLGTAQSPTRFTSLDWVDYQNPMGIVAGGMADGAITLWNVSKILDQSNDKILGKGCISAVPIHQGVPVNTIQFNPNRKSLLASGGAEVLILDITQNVRSPMRFKPGEPNLHEDSRITSISWNRQVPHILASASENGMIVVWDLKQSKSLFKFMEPQAQQNIDNIFSNGAPKPQVSKNISMMWNPDIPTQFMVATDDDQNPSFNIWDLRNSSYPVQSYPNIHSGGILSFSWNLQDPNLIVSTGNDQRCVVSNYKTSEIILEFPGSNIYNKVTWSQQLNGKMATVTDTGSTDILQLDPRSVKTVGEEVNEDEPVSFARTEVSQRNNKPYFPKYMQPKCGARFGFGGKLVTFHGKCLKATQIVHHTETDLSSKVQEFDQEVTKALQTYTLEKLIEAKAKEIEQVSHNEKLEILAIKSLATGSAESLLKDLGFDNKKVTFEVERFLGKPMVKNTEEIKEEMKKTNSRTAHQPPIVTENPFAQELPEMTAESAADFFSSLGQPAAQQTATSSAAGAHSPAPSKNQEEEAEKSPIDGRQRSYSSDLKLNKPQTFITETISKNSNWNEGHEGMIKRNLMFGNLQYAAEVALKCGRSTEALLIAELGGQDLFAQIKEKFFDQQKDPFIKTTIKSLTSGELDNLINECSSKEESPSNPVNWMETLAYLFAYEDDMEERNEMIKELGDKLVQQKEITPAIVCYIISQSVNETLDLWKRRALHNINSKEQTKENALFDLLVKFTLFKNALASAGCHGEVEPNQDYNLILIELGRYLSADQQAAVTFLKQIQQSSQPSFELQLLSSRIYTAHETVMYQRGVVQPKSPFQVERFQQQSNYGRQQQQRGPMRQAHQRQGGPQQNPRNIPTPVQPEQKQFSQTNPPTQVEQQASRRPIKNPINLEHSYGYGTQANIRPIQNQQEQTATPAQPQPRVQPQPRPTVRPSMPRPVTGGIRQVAPRPTTIRPPIPVQQPPITTPTQPVAPPRPAPPRVHAQPPSVVAEQQVARQMSEQPQHQPGPGITGPLKMTQQRSQPSFDQAQGQTTVNNQAAQAENKIPPPQVKQAQRPIAPRPMGPSSANVRPRFAPPRPNPAKQGRPGGQQDISDGTHATPTPPVPARPGAPPKTTPPPPVNRPGPPPPKTSAITPPMAPNNNNSQQQFAVNGAKCQETLNTFDQILQIFDSGETNPQVKQQAHYGAQILRAALESQTVSEAVCDAVMQVFLNLQQGNIQGCRQAEAQLQQQHWNESKDWISCIQAILNFAQRSF